MYTLYWYREPNFISDKYFYFIATGSERTVYDYFSQTIKKPLSETVVDNMVFKTKHAYPLIDFSDYSEINEELAISLVKEKYPEHFL